MKHIEALKLALEALETCGGYPEQEFDFIKVDSAITAIREALAEQPAQQCADCNGMGIQDGQGSKCKTCNGQGDRPAQQEPVAYLVYAKETRRYFTLTFDVEKVPEIYKGGEAVPLYTSPPAIKPWVGDTDELKAAFVAGFCRWEDFDDLLRISSEEAWLMYETKLREKNQ